MKHSFFPYLVVLTIGMIFTQNPLSAQRSQESKRNRQSRFVFAAEPQEWMNGRANLCASGYLLNKLAICAGGNFQATQFEQNNYLVQHAQTGWNVEARWYPFGGPRQFTALFKKRKKGTGCWQTASLRKKSAPKISPVAGFYLAPGFARTQQNLAYSPLFESLTPVFPYKIWQNSGTIATGFDIHIWRFTLGLRAQLAAGKAQWSGPVDIFGNSLNQVNYPFQMNVSHRVGIAVGINL